MADVAGQACALGVVAGEPFDGHAEDPGEVEGDRCGVCGGGDGDAGEEVTDGGGGPDDGDGDEYACCGGDCGEDGAVPVAGWDR